MLHTDRAEAAGGILACREKEKRIFWPAVDDKPQVMELGDRTQPVPLAGNPAKIQFFEKFLTKGN
jgi:hypothetical protein